MTLAEVAAKEGFSLVREIARIFSWRQLCQRYRAWSVLEWWDPGDGVYAFGPFEDTSRLYDLEDAQRANVKAAGGITYAILTPEIQVKIRKLEIEFEDREKEIALLRDKIWKGVQSKLQSCSLIARGFTFPHVHRAPYLVIPPEEWKLLSVDFFTNEAEGYGIKYIAVEIGRVGEKAWFNPRRLLQRRRIRRSARRHRLQKDGSRA